MDANRKVNAELVTTPVEGVDDNIEASCNVGLDRVGTDRTRGRLISLAVAQIHSEQTYHPGLEFSDNRKDVHIFLGQV